MKLIELSVENGQNQFKSVMVFSYSEHVKNIIGLNVDGLIKKTDINTH